MGTILVAAAVFSALGYTVFRMIRNKKNGNACSGCPSCGTMEVILPSDGCTS
jgi:hypothetical protein